MTWVGCGIRRDGCGNDGMGEGYDVMGAGIQWAACDAFSQGHMRLSHRTEPAPKVCSPGKEYGDILAKWFLEGR